MSIGIYRFKNLITLQSYIGQSINLEERYKHHQRAWLNGTTDFYKAVQQYGWNNFSYEVLEICSKEQLNEKERYWVAYYDSYYHGYNMNQGGSNKNSVDYTKVYELWKQGKTTKEISLKMNIGRSTVYNVLHSFPDFVLDNSSDNFKIYQYDLNGNFIKEWPSCKAVQRELNIDACAIGKVINKQRNTAGGFQWSNKYYNHIKPITDKANPKPIEQYDLKNNYIQTFKTLGEAARMVNGDASAIRCAANGGMKRSAYGFRWHFKEN